jgi:hypothetical protein
MNKESKANTILTCIRVAPISPNICMILLGTDLRMNLNPINFPAMDEESNHLLIMQCMGANSEEANVQNDHNYPKLALANFPGRLFSVSTGNSPASFA